MRMKITLLALAAIAFAAPASAQQLFDFLGQADVPVAVGGTLTMYGVVNDPAPGATPIPLDFADYQFTLVVTDLTLDADASTQTYSGGTITLYQDAGTAADYADPATFTDGTAILSGDLTALSRTMFTSTLGTANGVVDWTGGTRLDDIAPADQDNWAFLTGINANFAEDGYSEMWDGKVEPEHDIVPTEVRSWGSLKALLR